LQSHVDLRGEDERLRAALSGRRLVAEVTCEHADVERLRDALLVNVDHAWDYPSVAAIVTVGIGVHSYKSGDYWDSFPQLDVRRRQSWGERFEAFLSGHSTLETFAFLRKERAHRFVAPILAHGGVPRSCLGDLFGVLTSHCSPDQPGSEALDHIQAAKGALTCVSRPVERFIRHGGEVAEELVARLLALWEARDAGDTSARLGLPSHLVDDFDVWYRVASPSRDKQRRRFPSPTVHLDPCAMAIALRLPRCCDHRDAGRVWRALGQEWITDRESVIPLRAAAPAWKVDCGRRSFEFEASSDLSRALFFDPETGTLIRDPAKRRLPPQVWVVHQTGVTLLPHPVHREDLLPWRGFEISVLDLSANTCLLVGEQSFEVRRPFFETRDDEGIVPNVTGTSGLPVRRALPMIQWEGMANLDLVVDGKNRGNIDLTCGELTQLFDDPGQYDLHLRGPLGQNLELRYLFVPGLGVDAKPAMWLPESTVAQWQIHAPGALVSRENEPGTAFTTARPELQVDLTYPTTQLRLLCSVPRLEWCIAMGAVGPELSWTSHAQVIGVPELMESQAPLLECRVPTVGRDADVTLESKSGERLKPRPWRSRVESIWRFDLREARDLVMASGAPAGFTLVVRAQGVGHFLGKVLEVRPEWDMQCLSASWKHRDGSHRITIRWHEHGQPVCGRWLEVLPAWQPWAACILRRELAVDETALVELAVPEKQLRPGRYVVRAFHAPWGLADPGSMKQLQQVFVDVFPEVWPQLFAPEDSAVTVQTYLEALLAHCHNRERVRRPPRAPLCLRPVDILWFLDWFERSGAIEVAKIPRDGSGALTIFLSNPEATAQAMSGIKQAPESWRGIMPPLDILSLEPNEADCKFLVDLVLNDLRLGDHHCCASLSRPLQEWHRGLRKGVKSLPRRPRADEVIFLCERFGILRNRCRDAQEIYEALKGKYMSLEAV
jgi:hypothetical protein